MPVVIFVSDRTQSDIGPRGKEITVHVTLENNDKLLIFEATIKPSHNAITGQISHLFLCIDILVVVPHVFANKTTGRR